MLSRVLQKKNAVILSVPVIFFALYFSNVSAEIYKWVDGNGRTQYSDERPKDQKVKITTVRIMAAPAIDSAETTESDEDDANKAESKAGKDNVSSNSDNSRDSSPDSEKQENIKQARQERCEEARKEVIILSKDMPVYFDESENLRLHWGLDTYTGEHKYLSDKERGIQLAKAKGAIGDFCKEAEDESEQETVRKKWVRSEYCLANRARLKQLESEANNSVTPQLLKQQEITDEYCDGSASTSSSDLGELKIFRKPLVRLSNF